MILSKPRRAKRWKSAMRRDGPGREITLTFSLVAKLLIKSAL